MHNGAIMPSEVRHRVDAGQAFPLVRLTGVLDHDTAPEVRAALLDVLADQPAALVVDVAELRPAQPGAVAVLRDVRRETADWPAAGLALCDPNDSGRWRDTGWPVWSDSTDAFGSFGSPDGGHRLSLNLEPLAVAARRAREMITEACDRWDLADLAGSSRIVVTEMVNNVVVHARTPMIVLLAVHGSRLSVAVRDESPTAPTFTGTPALTAYGGRGMLLIDSVATRWGNLALSHGKVVWAILEAGESEIGSEIGSGLRETGHAGIADPLPG
jgi:STAS domain/Histidine kinase-like ATPase domain